MMAMESLGDKRILITGGTGNLGLALAKRLLGCCRSILLTDVREPEEEALKEKAAISFVKQDIAADDAWFLFEDKVDVIFHLAAQTSAYRSQASPAEDWRINGRPALQLLEFLKNRAWRPDIIFASTATVIGLTEKTPVTEDSREDPVTMYDVHKLLVEKYLRQYVLHLEGRAVALRLANVYGPGGGNTSVQDRGVVNQMVRRALSKEALTIYGNGEYRRDYVYTTDVVEAFVAAACHMESLNGGAFFIATGVGHTVKQLAEKIVAEGERVTGHKSEIRYAAFPAGALSIEERSFVADIKKFTERTGWSPLVDLDRGIALTAEYFVQKGA